MAQPEIATTSPSVLTRDYHLIEELSTTKLLYLAQQFLGFETVFMAAITDEAMRVLEVLHLPGAEATCKLSAPGTTPLAQTYCQFVYRSGRTLVVPDARNLAPFAEMPTTEELNIGAYVGVPLITHDGALFGTLCGIHPTPQTVARDRVLLLQMVAKALIHQIEQEWAILQGESNSQRASDALDSGAELPDPAAFASLLRGAVLRAALAAQPVSLLLFHPPPTARDLAAWWAEVAPLLSSLGAIGRFDVETFAVLMPNTCPDRAAAHWAARRVPPDISVGLAAYPGLASNETDLALRAFQALTAATGKPGDVCVWSTTLARRAA